MTRHLAIWTVESPAGPEGSSLRRGRAPSAVYQNSFLYRTQPLIWFRLHPKEFRAVHESLRQTPYIRWYRDQVSSRGFAIPDNVAGDLALDFMIGHDTSPPPEIDDLVQAKDYVASMTDRRALSVYTKIFGVAEKQS